MGKATRSLSQALSAAALFQILAIGCQESATGIARNNPTTGDGGGSGGQSAGGQNGGDAGKPCPSSGNCTPGTTCVNNPCHSCVCYSDGKWKCQGASLCGACPSPETRIKTGDPCTTRYDMACRDWAWCGAFGCICSGGTWNCVDTPCPPSPSSADCPAAKPNNGDSCGPTKSSCTYPWAWTCAAAFCDCDGSRWTCKYGDACFDGGL